MSARTWHVIWGSLLAGGVAAEAVALARANPEGTLSAHMRSVFGIQHTGPAARVRQVVFWAGLGWLVNHLYREGAGDARHT
ncbi:hypothetical protein [Streptomyces sp. NPDC093261]|uniref:hypothetical protein n=1 Tax=Streptomyces sp. NPDC093261 TaxID=3366037 RepID=UPI0038034F1A